MQLHMACSRCAGNDRTATPDITPTTSATGGTPSMSIGVGQQRRESVHPADHGLTATNTAEHPDRIVPRPTDRVEVADDVLHATLPAVSWTAVRLATV